MKVATIFLLAIASYLVFFTSFSLVMAGLAGDDTYEDWDVNCDNLIDVSDMVIIGQHWAETDETPHWTRADVSRDGVVNILDIILVGQHYTV